MVGKMQRDDFRDADMLRHGGFDCISEFYQYMRCDRPDAEHRTAAAICKLRTNIIDQSLKELFQIFTGAKLSLISKDAASNDTHMICNLLDF